MLIIVEVQTTKDFTNFLRFPNKLHQNDPYYVPQLHSEETSIFSNTKNDCFNFCDVRRFLVLDNKKVVGRFALIINKKDNEMNNKKELRFTRIDFIDDKYVFEIIFDKMREVARENNLDTIIGPFGFSNIDYNGLLIDNYDSMGTCYSNCCYDYVKNHFIENGFSVDKELFIMHLSINDYTDPRYAMMEDYLVNNFGLSVVRPDSESKNLAMMEEALSLLNTVNETYENDYYFLPLTKKQIHDLALFINEISNYDYVIGVYKDDKMIGFTLCAPSLAKALQKSKGSIGPITSIKLRNALRENDIVDMPFFIVSREYKDLGIDNLLFIELLRSFKKNGVKEVYTNPVNIETFPVNVLNGYTFDVYKKLGVLKYKL